jgi:FMN phosphatase YigB (HAD superfamily)
MRTICLVFDIDGTIVQRCRTSLRPTEETVYFGDGEWDPAAARALGWRFVGVGNRPKGKCPDWISDFSSLKPDQIDR